MEEAWELMEKEELRAERKSMGPNQREAYQRVTRAMGEMPEPSHAPSLAAYRMAIAHRLLGHGAHPTEEAGRALEELTEEAWKAAGLEAEPEAEREAEAIDLPPGMTAEWVTHETIETVTRLSFTSAARAWINYRCPYCGTRQHLVMDLPAPYDSTPIVVRCDCEDYPGCDRALALRIETRAIVTAYPLPEPLQ